MYPGTFNMFTFTLRCTTTSRAQAMPEHQSAHMHNIYIYIYTYMYICMYVCMYVCISLSLYIYIYTYVYIYIYIYIPASYNHAYAW